MLPIAEDSKITLPFLPWDQILEKLLGDIVVHTLSVLLARKDIAFLQPLLLAFTDPFQLQVCTYRNVNINFKLLTCFLYYTAAPVPPSYA